MTTWHAVPFNCEASAIGISGVEFANPFGHVHNSPIIKDYSSQHYCVSVERIGYTPISFEEIVKTVTEKSKNKIWLY